MPEHDHNPAPRPKRSTKTKGLTATGMTRPRRLPVPVPRLADQSAPQAPQPMGWQAYGIIAFLAGSSSRS